MEHRLLGASGFSVPILCLGTATFGGAGEVLKIWGQTQVDEATRMVDVALDAGVTLFDSADAYSTGLAEEILGKAIAGRRSRTESPCFYRRFRRRFRYLRTRFELRRTW